MRSAFEQQVRDAIEARAVGRDNPVHRAFVAGMLGRDALHELARQQWLFHEAFPGILATLAGECPDRVLRAVILAEAYEQETGKISGDGSKLELWERVCAALGVPAAELPYATPLPTTEAMLAIQRWVARLPFPEAYVGLLAGIVAESAPHMHERRTALEQHYDVAPEALAYFPREPATDPLPRILDAAWPLIESGRSAGRALVALRVVLHARWEYFSGVVRVASTTTAPPTISPC